MKKLRTPIIKPTRTCVTLNVPQSFKDILQKVADENRRSLSSQVILMLEEYLSSKKAK
jgi:hypothetical protein